MIGKLNNALKQIKKQTCLVKKNIKTAMQRLINPFDVSTEPSM